jgi:uncharacterized protein YdeI (YjbR/CyaY-like superfamily)
MSKETQKLHFKTRGDFRAWLKKNAETSGGVWLVFGKTKAVVSLSAAEALEEALCFGWIDGQIESVDDNSYLKYFKQRAKNSNWSEKNQKLAEKLEHEGLMTEAGRAKIEHAKQNGTWNAGKKPEPLSPELLRQFCDMVKPFEPACTNLMKMPPSVRRNYAASYFFGAKTEEGKQRRFDTIIERLNLNLDPMQSMKKALEKLQ